MFNNSLLMFEEKLYNLINNCGLTIGEAYYIVNNAALELKLKLYEISIKEQMDTEQHHTQEIDVPVPVDIDEEKEIINEQSVDTNAS